MLQWCLYAIQSCPSIFDSLFPVNTDIEPAQEYLGFRDRQIRKAFGVHLKVDDDLTFFRNWWDELANKG